MNEEDRVRQAVDRAHEELWRRFVNGHGILFDYVTPAGEALVPSREECKLCKPNGLAWWCPTENGAFFNGLYLDGLCNRWRETKRPEDAERARRIARGLLLLARVGETPGFIARGIATDGHSHHPAGSDDQTLPWFYGLWRYVKSGIPTPPERQEIIALMTATAVALEQNRWRMPCDPPSFGDRGVWGDKSPVSVPRLLFVVRAMHDLTGEERWLAAYHHLVAETPVEAAKSRLEICGDGSLIPEHARPDRGYFAFWTKASVQACLTALCEMETDPAIRRRYEDGRACFARMAAQHIGAFRQYKRDDLSPAGPDWRALNEWWEPQSRIDHAVQVAERQAREWYRIFQRKGYEARCMQEPLFAAWIVTLSGDRRLVAECRDEIRSALTHYDWRDLCYATFFVAECAAFEGFRHGL